MNDKVGRNALYGLVHGEDTADRAGLRRFTDWLSGVCVAAAG